MYAATEIVIYCIVAYFVCAWGLKCDPSMVVLLDNISCNGPCAGSDLNAAIPIIIDVIPDSDKTLSADISYPGATVTINSVLLDGYGSSLENPDPGLAVVMNGISLNSVGGSRIFYTYPCFSV